MIATNTIAQGDTRSTGLRWICTNAGTIYKACKRLKWPGQAAVVVSVIQVIRGALPEPFDLDGVSVPIITAYLFHAGSHENPATLEANNGRSFQGCVVVGMGFTFDDTGAKGIANRISLMHDLVQKDPRNANCIFPYVGGEEINESPTQTYDRYIINFEDWPLRRSELETRWSDASGRQREAWLREGVVPLDYPYQVAADYPDLLRIVEEKVKPEREQKGATGGSDKLKRAAKWWQFSRTAKDLYHAVSDLNKVIAVSRVGQQCAFAFLPTGMVYADSLVVFAFSSFGAFCTLQSRPHEIWARLFSSSMKDDLRYTSTDCFETFPFPRKFGSSQEMEAAGRQYYEFRAALMVKNSEGLTATYNRFHDPEEENPDILRLRELHASMDRAVLDAYGWTDIEPKSEFLLDYEEEEDEEENGPRRRKKPWRYRWPDEIRD